LVQNGFGRVQKKQYKNKLYERLRKDEEKAKTSRLNLWEYGDIPDSDDEKNAFFSCPEFRVKCLDILHKKF